MSNHKLSEKLSYARTKALDILDQIEAGGAIDTELYEDSVEGETNFNEIIDELVKIYKEREAAAKGIKAHVDELNKKVSQKKATVEIIRVLILREMQKAKIKQTRGVYTVSVKSMPNTFDIEDESKIPAKYWEKVESLSLKKDALLSDLNAETKIEGVKLVDARFTIGVR